MRRGLLVFIIITLAVFAFLLNHVWTLLTLLVVDGRQDAVLRAELPEPGEESQDKRPSLIPKILHQTYKNASIPPVWQNAQASCLALLKEEDGWEYKLWTDELSRNFIEKEYSWFLETFDGYPYPIQRADAIRYFVLAYYGGVYLDLDDGCKRPLEPLLAYPAFARRTLPTGISNDIMGSVPGHPFFMFVLEEIQKYDRSWILPYITVMGSTGPLFLSVLWRRYIMKRRNIGDGADGGRIRMIFPDEAVGQTWSFFTQHVGSSWHAYDVKLIFWLSRNWILVTIFGFIAGFGVLFLAYWAYRHCVLFNWMDGVPKWKGVSRSRLPFWRRVSARKVYRYELVDRHEV